MTTQEMQGSLLEELYNETQKLLFSTENSREKVEILRNALGVFAISCERIHD